MSRRKQLNPRPLGEYTRTKSQEPTSQDQGEIHKKTPQKTFNDQMVASDEDEESAHLMIDESHIRANGARIPSEHFPLTYPYPSPLICPLPTTSTGRCSPQSPFSNGDTSSSMMGSSETMKGKKLLPDKRKSDGKILPTGKDGQNGYVCPQCDLFLSSQHELTSHLRSHNGVNNSRSEHQCHQCWKILSSSSSLDRHMLTHSGEKPFSCRICKQAFTTNGNMHRHMRTHEKKNEQRRAALLKPKNKSSSSSSKMDLFNESVVDTSASKNSYRLPDVEMVSPSMFKPTWSPSTLTHINKKPASESREDLTPKPSLPSCQTEGQDLSQKPLLKYPLPPSLPLHPPAETSPRHPLHYSPTASPLNSITTVEFSNSKFPLICIAEGSKNGHRPKTGQQEYGCDDCSLYFPCKKALDLHLQAHYTDQPTSCRVCNLTFSSPENYQQHRFRYHTDGEDEKQAVFMSSLNLRSNQKSPKMAESSSSCINGIDDGSHCHSSEDTEPGSVSPQLEMDEQCEEDTNSMLAVPKEEILNDSEGIPANDSHNIPQDESNNNNNITSKNLISIVGEKALNAENAKKKASYTCTYCNKDFINTRAAKSHERSHLGLSPYQCKSCSYSSPDKSTLIRHMRTHNGERPYQCKLCNYAFTTKANCERHVKKKHNILDKEELEAKVGYNKDTKEAQDDSFSSPDTVCKYCNKDFKYFRRLKHHLRGHRSSEEKPFKCKQCDMGFSTKANCVRHIQNKHTDISHVDIENYVQMQESMFTSFMGHSGSPRCTSAPPPAHSPAGRFSDDSAEDAKPLDLRSSRNLSQSNSPAVNGGSFICLEEDLDNNEPIDLSIKRATKKAIRKMPRIPDPNTQCPYCDQEFGSEFERQYHIKMSHDQTTNPGERRFPIMKQSVPNYVSPQGSAVSLHEDCSTPLTKKIKMEPNQHKDQSPNIDDCNSDDLASVSQILNTTGANFEAYFANHEDDDPEPLTGQQANGYNSSPSEYGNDGSQIKDEPHDLEDSEFIDVAGEESNLNNSSDSKDMATRQEPEGDSSQKSQKKKRNSYADSPHKLKCPHCPRHFPWASSLNRHILTHTGEKPFECPKCHVIFSTKSNRERHLTRKHGVNMLDPAARQTMDRPFKCHLCTFSSFATKDNLLRHYRDRHPEDPLPEGLSDGADKPSSSGASPQQQKTKFHTGSSDIKMELKSPESTEKDLSDECGPIPSKLPERENTFRDDDVGMKGEELEEINNNNVLHWTQKPTDPQGGNSLTSSKSHLCYTCGYKLSNPRLLQQHLKVHSKDLPFKCHVCDTSFHERIRCLKHLEKTHGTEWSMLTSKNKITDVEEFSDDVGQRCQEYVEQLSDRVEPNSHVTNYLGKKVYCCLCTERFWSRQELRPHMHSHTVCKLTNKEKNIPSNVSETDPLLAPTTLTRASSDFPVPTEEPGILPTMLGMDASSIDRLLDSVMAGGRLSTNIP